MTNRRVTIANTAYWFCPEESTSWSEESVWDGNNHISRATGSQWEHQTLYLSRKGTWIIHSWSQMQGTMDGYSIVDTEDAAEWLIANGLSEDLSMLPEAIRLEVVEITMSKEM